MLAKEPPDAQKFAGLVRSGLERLHDAENETASLDGRFDLAYSALHALNLDLVLDAVLRALSHPRGALRAEA